LSAHRCAVCERPRDEWAIEEGLRVAFRNHLLFEACEACWGKWPDGHKTFPSRGFGRWPEDEPARAGRIHVVYDERGEIVEYELLPALGPDVPLAEDELEALVAVLRETA
jgi:hypothetical protein